MAEEDQGKCPVDHSTRDAWLKKASVPPEPVPVPEDQPKCPVDHDARADWLSKVSVVQTTKQEPEAIEVSSTTTCSSDKLDTSAAHISDSNSKLPTEREISSIPRTSGQSNWIYPSQKQFFEAMKRKNWEPEAQDMKTVVPIHNAVNEKAWSHILNWERSHYQQSLAQCGGIKLTSFKGDSKKLTPRAWFNSTILGYEKPFDRHDWIIDRCGTEVEYVIDFYGGNGEGASFFLDVRPKLNNWEGLKLRFGRAFGWE
ncbi:DEHA2G18128p [Debaryomyces hansenii CBS767]|uniref:Holocytochrome c-type synthase n=1 Tax=Debaryomyces hansenii (strain ATCC 36239 / CBS 767 / BCRC 21394 / JCM 1990 / NBRC 0083 / IGC 2968) TaxID=284592 RepID=Q6BHJ2_DEBHA|nr:DEHA2G18128p [Debaryomyces hansenii CBS767]CAG90835.2 DEHA2G18128p [Debaryomyces hansenii CBS767]|eukprot:XP_462329.2 DEHA2G18128p [Debaryomyces hansenii CBS767]